MFFVVSFALMVGYTILMQKMRGPQVANNPAAAQKHQAAAPAKKPGEEKNKAQAEGQKNAEKETAAKTPAENNAAEKETKEPGEKKRRKSRQPKRRPNPRSLKSGSRWAPSIRMIPTA